MSSSFRWAALALVILGGACGGAQTAPPQQPVNQRAEEDVSLDEAAGIEGAEAEVVPPDSDDWSTHATAKVPVSEEDPMWGDPLAPVTIVEFADFECPFSGKVQPTLAALQERYGQDKIRIVWKHNPLPFHKHAVPAHEAAAALHHLLGNGAFWSFKELAYQNRDALTAENFSQWAQELGASKREFEKALKDKRYAVKVDRDKQLAREVDADGTPHFRINGVTLSGAQPLEKFVEVIDAQLAVAGAMRDTGDTPQEIYPKLVAKNVQLKDPVEASKPPSPDLTVWAVPVYKDDPKKGGKEPLVTIVEFAEFQCPFCKRVLPTLAQVLDRYGDDVRIVWKDHPLGFHPRAKSAAEVARAAYEAKGDTGFWTAHDAIFASQPALEDTDLVQAALTSGAPEWRIRGALRSSKYDAKFEQSIDLAGGFEARGTPHFFINGVRLKGAQPFEEFEKVIDEQLAKARALVASGVPRSQVYERTIAGGKPPPPPVRKEVGPAPADAPFKGLASGRVVIQMFGDFQCPFCKRSLVTIGEVMSKHKNVKLVWRNLPLPFHKEAPLAAEAAMEVHRQRGNAAFWKFHDKLFEEQTTRGLDRAALEAHAIELGNIDMDQFRDALDTRKHQAKVTADAEVARQAGITGTPGFTVNGYYVSGAQPYGAFKRAIQLASQGP